MPDHRNRATEHSPAIPSLHRPTLTLPAYVSNSVPPKSRDIGTSLPASTSSPDRTFPRGQVSASLAHFKARLSWPAKRTIRVSSGGGQQLVLFYRVSFADTSRRKVAVRCSAAPTVRYRAEYRDLTLLSIFKASRIFKEQTPNATVYAACITMRT